MERLRTGSLIATLVMGAATLTPAAQAAGLPKPDVWAGDYFSDKYAVNAPIRFPWSGAPDTTAMWSVTRNGKKVAWHDRGKLAPGSYTMRVRVVPDADFAPTTSSLGRLQSGYRTWSPSISNLTFVALTHEKTTTSGGQVVYDYNREIPGVRFWELWEGTCYSPDYLKSWSCHYYIVDAKQVEVPADQASPSPAGNSDFGAGVFYAPDGNMVITPVVTNTETIIDGYRGTGTLTMRFERGNATYQGPFTITDYSLAELKSRPYGHIPSSTRLTLVKKPPKVLYEGSTRFTVKARNGNDVTRREAHAVGPGDSMVRVKAVFGTDGSTEIKGSNGIQVRSYDGWVVIGFVNGRVNTIQYL